jgi:dTDP-glucose 4,6-dehydratase
MNILVCGGAGFIGSAFIRNHLNNSQFDKIINLDNLSVGSNLINLDNIKNNPNYQFVKGDIRNLELVKSLAKDVDLIVNFAAESHVDRSISNPFPFIETNIIGIYSLLEATRLYDKILFQISTDEVYGEAPDDYLFNENDCLNPSNPYAATKASGDELIKSYYRTYDIKCNITRCTNNYGPFQFPEKLIPKTIIRAQKNMSIPLHGGGVQKRSWIFVLDHISGIETVIQKAKYGEIYNISDSHEYSIKSIVEKILQIMNKSLDLIEDVKDRPGQDRRYAVDTTKIQSLGWKPKYQFDDSLKNTIYWYLENKQWWEKIVDDDILHSSQWTVKY